MKKLALVLTLIIASVTATFGLTIVNFDYKLSYNSTLARYEAYAIPRNSGQTLKATSQFTIASDGAVIPDINVVDGPSNAVWAKLENTLDNGVPNNPVNTSGVYTGNRYFLVQTNTAGLETYTAGVPVLLFTFTFPGGCDPSIRIWKNGVDPTSSFLTGGGDYRNIYNQVPGPTDGYKTNLTTSNIGCPINVGGKLWDDANGDKAQNGAEALINGKNDGTNSNPTTGAPLYANLADENGKVTAVVPVNANGTYLFTNVPSGVDGMKIQISSSAATVGAMLPAATLPANWVNTGTNAGTAAATGNTASQTGQPVTVILLNTGTTNITNQNFGIEKIPVSDSKFFPNIPQSAFTTDAAVTIGGNATSKISSSSASLNNNVFGNGNTLSGTDLEDCIVSFSCTTNRAYEVKSINANTRLFYNGAEVIPGTATAKLNNFNPALLVIYGQKGTGLAGNPLGFTYTIFDNAGQESNVSTYNITTPAPLPLLLVNFTATKETTSALLAWETANEKNCDYFGIERSADAKTWAAVGSTTADGSLTYRFKDALPVNGANYYRLKIMDLDGSYAYSPVRSLSFSNGTKADVVSLYPNPAKATVTINGLEAGATITILSMNGQLEGNYKTTGSSLIINLNELATGHYLVRVLSAAGEVLANQKLVKQ